jgi:ankyrin repeat protein
MNNFKFLFYFSVAAHISSSFAGAFEDFFQAVRTDKPNTVAQLLQRGFDPNAHEEGGQTALGLAIREGSEQVIDVLLKEPQLQINAQNHAGETALMLAALKGRLETVRRLLERGAAVDQAGWNALHYAAAGPEPQIVTLLLTRGASIEAPSPNGTTALMMAARYGSEESVGLLLARQADAATRNERGLNAADFARSAGREALAKRLESRLR